MPTDLCGPREFCQSGGYNNLQWMCDLWKDCANDSNDNCSGHLSPQPGKSCQSEQAGFPTTLYFNSPSFLLDSSWLGLSLLIL